MKYSKIVALSALLAVAAGCTDAENAVQTAEAMGFTQVQAGEYAWFSCGKEDDLATRFTAVNANGQRVTGVVCKNFIGKDATIRGLRIID